MTFLDKAVARVLISLSIIAIIFQSFLVPYDKGERVNITVNGEPYGSYEFSERVKTFEIETEFGKNTVKIDKDSVWVESADCPDKLDVKMGKIDSTNQRIICLPNRLMIEISGKEQKVDRVTY